MSFEFPGLLGGSAGWLNRLSLNVFQGLLKTLKAVLSLISNTSSDCRFPSLSLIEAENYPSVQTDISNKEHNCYTAITTNSSITSCFTVPFRLYTP